jgi:hypothetical protein
MIACRLEETAAGIHKFMFVSPAAARADLPSLAASAADWLLPPSLKVAGATMATLPATLTCMHVHLYGAVGRQQVH